MTTLASDNVRAYELGDQNDLPVISGDIIYEGAAVGDNGSGYMRPLVAGDAFRGFAYTKTDNAAGNAGDKLVKLRQCGRVKLNVAALAITDVGKPVYASDDDTFVLTATSNSYVGRVIRWVSAGVGIVEFDASKSVLGSVTSLTDSSGGTPSDTLPAIGASYVQADLRNAFASIAAKINSLAAQLK